MNPEIVEAYQRCVCQHGGTLEEEKRWALKADGSLWVLEPASLTGLDCLVIYQTTEPTANNN